MRKKKSKVKTVSAKTQNEYNRVCAETLVRSFQEKQKIIKVEELEKIGYEYNNSIHALLTLDTVIPYDFVLYCLLKENLDT